MRRLLLFVVALLASVAALAQSPEASKLKPGDLLAVNVAGFKDYSGEYRVLEDGSISGIAFGRLVVAGKTVEETKTMIVKELKKRFKDPFVDVILREQRPSYVFVIGAAQGSNGQVPLIPGTDLRQLLGTITLPDQPDLLEIRVSRKGEAMKTLDLKRFLTGEETYEGELQPGDVVSILPRTIRVTVAGEVSQPGEYVLRNDAGVNVAIANAKGVAPEGSLKNVVVFRGSNVYQVDASAAAIGENKQPFGLQAGDLIYVRKNEYVVYALGEVRTPGRIIVPDGEKYTAADVLAKANGLSDKGTLRRVTLIRPDSTGKFVAKQFHLDEFLKDGKKESNPELVAGDILLFGTPKGVTIGTLTQVASAALLFETLFRR